MTEPTRVRPGASTAARATVLAVILGLAAACWMMSVRLMNGMDMGVATRPGPFGFFAVVWIMMMAAMMLPGAAPAVLRRVKAGGGLAVAAAFAGSYLAVWALAGIVVYALDRPHGTLAAGTVVIAAGSYEFTPLKQRFRQRCHEAAGSGFRFGIACAGSTAGLMGMLTALSVMSIPWMAAITVVILAQKLLPARAAVDVPVAVAITGLGIVIVLAPSLIPGLNPPM